MRVRPRPSLGWIIGIGYALLFLVLEKIMGVGYDVIGTNHPQHRPRHPSSRSPSARSCSSS